MKNSANEWREKIVEPKYFGMTTMTAISPPHRFAVIVLLQIGVWEINFELFFENFFCGSCSFPIFSIDAIARDASIIITFLLACGTAMKNWNKKLSNFH